MIRIVVRFRQRDAGAMMDIAPVVLTQQLAAESHPPQIRPIRKRLRLDSAKLRACLGGQDPTVAMGAAVALVATFFALITTFIGERLTTQALRSAWPHIDQTAPPEKKQ